MTLVTARRPRCIVITGANGNLGRKIIPALVGIDSLEKIVALDPHRPHDPIDERVHWHEADLTCPISDWQHWLEGADTIIHLAATNPAPDSGWDHAFAGFDMTARLVQYGLAHGIERMIFASSNHAMGGHFREEGPAVEPGSLKGSLLPRPGTRWSEGGRQINSIIYGSSKGYGERLLAMAAEASAGSFSAVSIRVGWVQPGENLKQTISIGDRPQGTDEPALVQHWFESMWLSNRDLEQLFRRAVEAGTGNWPSPAIVVNGVSDNAGMGWSLDEGETWLGYRPLD